MKNITLSPLEKHRAGLNGSKRLVPVQANEDLEFYPCKPIIQYISIVKATVEIRPWAMPQRWLHMESIT